MKQNNDETNDRHARIARLLGLDPSQLATFIDGMGKVSIAALNDRFRAHAFQFMPPAAIPGRVVLTRGVHALGPDALLSIIRGVREFAAFTPDNDPHLEHDFGGLTVEGVRLFWKIDYYANADMEFGCEDPSDPAQSYRLLTIMLAEEY